MRRERRVDAVVRNTIFPLVDVMPVYPSQSSIMVIQMTHLVSEDNQYNS